MTRVEDTLMLMGRTVRTVRELRDIADAFQCMERN